MCAPVWVNVCARVWVNVCARVSFEARSNLLLEEIDGFLFLINFFKFPRILLSCVGGGGGDGGVLFPFFFLAGSF